MNLHSYWRNLYPKVEKRKNAILLYITKYKSGTGGKSKVETEYVKIGESLIVEGGPSTGKTSFLQKTVNKLEAAGENCIFVNATLPIGDWVKEYKLFGKNLEKRIEFFVRQLPKTYYLIIDNAEKLTDSRQLELVLYLMEHARSVIVGCGKFTILNPKLKTRFKNTKVHHLGSGADTFDITYFVLAIIIVFIAVLGATNLVFLAAAFRYMFQGTRMGGRSM